MSLHLLLRGTTRSKIISGRRVRKQTASPGAIKRVKNSTPTERHSSTYPSSSSPPSQDSCLSAVSKYFKDGVSPQLFSACLRCSCPSLTPQVPTSVGQSDRKDTASPPSSIPASTGSSRLNWGCLVKSDKPPPLS